MKTTMIEIDKINAQRREDLPDRNVGVKCSFLDEAGNEREMRFVGDFNGCGIWDEPGTGVIWTDETGWHEDASDFIESLPEYMRETIREWFDSR